MARARRSRALLRLLRTAALSCALSAGYVSSVAHGQDEPSSPEQTTPAQLREAKQRHRAAVTAFAHKHYQESIRLFTEADKLQPSALISYNIARAYEALQRPELALDSYRRYLERADHPPDAALVARKIARLSRQVAELAKSEPERDTLASWSPNDGESEPARASSSPQTSSADDSARETTSPERDSAEQAPRNASQRALEEPLPSPPATPAPKHRDSSGSAWTTVGWVTLATGAAALGGALVFEELRQSAQDTARSESEQIKYAQALQTMQSRQDVARVLAAAGGAAVLGGVTLFIIGASAGAGSAGSERQQAARSTATQLGLSCALAECKLTVRGRY